LYLLNVRTFTFVVFSFVAYKTSYLTFVSFSSGVGAVPSTMHQRLSIWREDGLLENIKADKSYFLAEVNNITKKFFDK